MTTMPMMSRPVCLKLIQAIIIMVCLVLQVEQLVCAKDAVRCIQRERQALLQLKAALVDPFGMLSSWTTADCCQWKGIRCSNLTGHVLRLDLTDDESYISGEIHKSLMELQQLKYLNLSGNSFEGSHIPDFFASLINLRYLDLSRSDFGGKIPTQIGSLSHLKYLDLRWNNYLEGSIPYQLGNLSNLQFLDLSYNSLEGSIPSQLGNLSNLQFLDLSYNSLEGSIPSQLGNLSNLQFLDLSYINSLEGSIPSQLGNLSSLQFLDLRGNSLEGSIPSQLGKLSNLQELYLGGYDALKLDDGNHSGGQWLSNLTSLTHLSLWDIANLNSSHIWLQMIGKLPKLRELSLYGCSLSDNFIRSLSPSKFNFSTSLSVLDLSSNSFSSSMIFQWVSNFSSNLVELDLSYNLLEAPTSNHFAIDEMISKLPKLKELSLSECNLSDNFLLSKTTSKFNFSTSLSVLDLSSNRFTSSSMIFQWVSNFSSNLVELHLFGNNLLEAPTSNDFGIVMNSLERLDLSYNSLKGGVLKSFMNICTLRALNMVENNLTEDLPSILRNLSGGCVRNSLQELDLSYNKITGSLPDLSMFSSLKTLALSYNQLSGKIPEGSSLPSQLEDLSIYSNSLVGGIPKSFGNACALHSLRMEENNLTKDLPSILRNLSGGCVRNSLQELDLSSNKITGSLPDLSMFSSLKTLDLSRNQLSGKIPEGSNLPSQLEHLSIKSTSLVGGIPKSFGNACALRSLDLSNNSLSDELPVIIHHLSGCATYSLQKLDLSMNQINGTLPDLSIFSSLKILYLYENRLNGKIPQDIRFPTQLEKLDMSSNSLDGVISDSHFANMSKLKSLDLSDNSLVLTFTQNWVPPFKLREIELRSCKLGLAFPKWLQTQDNFQDLDISNAGISDIVPEWFWAKLAFKEWDSVNISHNNLKGIIPNFSSPVKNPQCYSLSLASNQFEGPIPPFLRAGGVALDLSKNKFSDSLSFLCVSGIDETLYQLDLSNNWLNGQIPDCWSHHNSLAYLDLSHNNFSGKIPTSMGSLLELQALILRNNSLTGEIPFSLMNCTKLVMLDAGENKLSGLIPSWIGSKLQELQVLSLGRNHFFGSLPLELCYLKSIQLLDLSLNNLSGQIPKCIKNFTSMAQKTSSGYHPGHSFFVNATGTISGNWSYYLNAFLMWKGVEQMFNNNELFLIKSIDLSSNHFSEEIPAEIEYLFELVSLNLSRNDLTGKIPSNIGKLTSLEFLDLSRNQLTGSIPSSLTQIYGIGVLDLSHNHLSGKIPTSTQLQSFNASSYEDNLDLCGPPLEKLCVEVEPPHDPKVKIQEDEDLLITRGFYFSMAFGFVIGFWGVFGSILVKRSWRHAYFKFLNNLVDSIYVMAVVKFAKCKRWLKD